MEGISAEYVGLGVTQEDRRNNTVSLSYTHNFSPNVINEARGGFNRQSLLSHSNTTLQGFLSSIGFTQSDISAYGSVVGAFALSTFGHPAINFSKTFTTFNNGGRNTFRPLNQNLVTFGDTLTWIKGRHAFRMGGDLVRNAAVDGFALNRGNPRGSMTYAGTRYKSIHGVSVGAAAYFRQLGIAAASSHGRKQLGARLFRSGFLESEF